MSREIKFRAWDKKKKRMTYSNNWSSLNFRTNGDMFRFMIGKDDYNLIDYQMIVEQFTGLVDKNGVEIYEGDIVSNLIGEVFIVGYGAPSFWLYRNLDDEVDVERFNNHIDTEEVIGNIHENPELLK